MDGQPIEIAIPRDCELRIYVPLDEPLPNRQQGTGASVRLLGPPSGSAANSQQQQQRVEVFGAQMIPQARYFLQRGSVVVVCAWTDAKVELTGSATLLSPQQWWVGGDGMHARPLLEYHAVLATAREAAKGRRDAAVAEAERVAVASAAASKTGDDDDAAAVAAAAAANASIPAFAGGPRVLICGKEGSGKHTAMRTLANYAARQHYPTTVVDLSLATQSIGLPGSVASCVADYPLPASEPNYDASPSRLAYYVGAMETQPEDGAATFATTSGWGPSGGLLSADGAGGVGAGGPSSSAAGGAQQEPLKTICGAAAHYTRLLAGRVAERLGPSLTTAEGAVLAPYSIDGSHSPIPAAPSAIARSDAAVAGAIVVAPNVRGADGAQYLATIVRDYGITHVLCIGDGEQLSALQHILKDAEEERIYGKAPTMPARGLSTCVGIGASAAFATATAASSSAAEMRRPLNTFAGVRLDFLSPNPAIAPRSASYLEKMSEIRCTAHFHGSGLVRYVPLLYARNHETMSMWHVTARAAADEADGAQQQQRATVAPFASPMDFAPPPVKNLSGKLATLRYAKADLAGLAGRLCAIVDLTGNGDGGGMFSGAAAGGRGGGLKAAQSSLAAAPVLCYAQMRDPDANINMLVACPTGVLDGMPHVAVVVGAYAYTQVYQE